MTSKCPTCFIFVPAQPAFLLCEGTCSPTRDDKASEVRGYTVLSKPVYPATAPACGSCGQRSRQEACPHCHGVIPPNWRSAAVTCVAMAGARATGKSLTLAVAVTQLELLVEKFHGSGLVAEPATERLFADRYTRLLYEQRQLLPPTPSSQSGATEESTQPLIFSFTERLDDGSSRPRFLVIRDAAGEDIEKLGSADASLTYFSRADCVIALLDPLNVPEIQHMLADVVTIDALGGDGMRVLRHVLSLMNGHSPTGKTSIPIAVALSKADVLQSLRDVEGVEWQDIMNRPGAALQRDPSLQGAGFDRADGELLHWEVLGLLERLNAVVLTSLLTERAENFQFFAVSALGAAPEGSALDAGGIAPFRVLDPFKWALEVSV